MSMSRSIRTAAGLAMLAAFGVLPGCGGGMGESASAPPKIDAPPPAVSPEAQKKYERSVPNAGMSSSSGAVDSTQTGS